MVIDDYTSAAGGSLKLKGVKDSKIDKKKKKKKKTQPEDNPTKGSATSDLNQDEDPTHSADSDSRRKMLGNALAEEDGENEGRPLGAGKTEAERRHEERRRKRVSGNDPAVQYLEVKRLFPRIDRSML